MKTPLWEASAGALAALLATRQFVKCDLHTITLAAGAGTLRYSAGDLDVTYPSGPTWSQHGPKIDPKASRQLAHWKRGLDTDQWLTVLLPRSVGPITGTAFPDKINGTPFIAACRQGALDGSTYQVDRAYFAAWPQPYTPVATPVGIITMFAGITSEVDTNDVAVALTSNDYRVLLGASMPRNTYQAGCGHTLFDAGCALTPATFQVAGQILAGSTRSVLIVSIPINVPGSGTLALGRVVMTSGLNNSFARTVSAALLQGGGQQTLSLLNPLPYDVAVGDQFLAYPGCDKQQTTCILFGNKVNYGGQDYIPSPETAI